MKECNCTYCSARRESSYPGSLETQAVDMQIAIQEAGIGWSDVQSNGIARMCAFAGMAQEPKGDPMVAKKRNIVKRLPKFGLAIFAMILSLAADVQAQNFINTGVYKGPGLFRVRNQATGLPDTVTGTFEYFGGGNQQVENKNFENLLLTGNGSTKQTTGNVGILRTVAVADGVRFEVNPSMALETLNGRITQENGIIIGRVTKTVDLNIPSDSSDFGGIGFTIRSQGAALGTTNIIRISGPSAVVSSHGGTSIQRLFDVQPANTTGLKGLFPLFKR
jgi:hypothetical protein